MGARRTRPQPQRRGRDGGTRRERVPARPAALSHGCSPRTHLGHKGAAATALRSPAASSPALSAESRPRQHRDGVAQAFDASACCSRGGAVPPAPALRWAGEAGGGGRWEPAPPAECRFLLPGAECRSLAAAAASQLPPPGEGRGTARQRPAAAKPAAAASWASAPGFPRRLRLRGVARAVPAAAASSRRQPRLAPPLRPPRARARAPPAAPPGRAAAWAPPAAWRGRAGAEGRGREPPGPAGT